MSFIYLKSNELSDNLMIQESYQSLFFIIPRLLILDYSLWEGLQLLKFTVDKMSFGSNNIKSDSWKIQAC